MPNTPQTKGTNVLKSKTKYRINKRQRNRRRNKQKLLNSNHNKPQSRTQISFSQSAQKNGVEVWSAAYQNAVRWHSEHQNNFWRHAAEQLENENQMLRQQLLQNVAAKIKPEMHLTYETSDEDDEEEHKDVIAIKEEKDEDEIDSKYLEFLQITIKHREELRLKREAADMLEQEASSTEKTC